MDDTPTNVFRIQSPHWAWLRDNFTLPSVLSMGAVISGAAWYCISLSNHVDQQSRDMRQLTSDVGEVKHLVEGTARDIAEVRRGQTDQDQRLTRIENNWDDAAHVVATAPRKRAK